MDDAELQRRGQAARDLNELLNRDDGERIVASLCEGLDLLRDQLFIRIHQDVEQAFGVDSMLVPVSESTTELATKLEIEIFQAASCWAAGCNFGYFPRDDARVLPWFTRLRLGADSEIQNVRDRLGSYLAKNEHERRLAFLDVIARTAREARHAPLVLFRLYPRGIPIVLATAFNDMQHARTIRDKQIHILPAIEGCDACRGRVLPNGTQCSKCGNPVWTYARMNMDE